MGFWRNVLKRVAERVELKSEVALWDKTTEGIQTIYQGAFRVYDKDGKPRMKVQGRIVVSKSFPAEVYLYDPPIFTKNHQHGSCLQLLSPNDKWFKLHWQSPAKDFESAYGYIEQMLSEGYRLHYR